MLAGKSHRPTAHAGPSNRGKAGAVSLATLLAFTSIGVVMQAGTAAAAPLPSATARPSGSVASDHPAVTFGVPAPVAAPLTTSGVGTAEQETVPVQPSGGQLTLVSGGADVTFIYADAGFYTINPVGGTIVFEPKRGFSGVAPAITYKITNALSQSASNTYTATVTVPPGPTATNLSSTRSRGAGYQYANVDIPNYDMAYFIVNGQQVTTVDEPGMGTYAIQSGDGINIDFNALECFVGTVPTVAYRIVDPYAQTASATYTAHVTNALPPTAGALTSTGAGPGSQNATAIVPACGATAHLLNAGQPVTTVSRPGIGTFTIVPTTGVITFTPVGGYAGTPAPVGYSVTDAQGQSASNTYTPTVTTPASPTATALTSTGVGTEVQSRTETVPSGGSIVFVSPDLKPVTTLNVNGGTYTVDPTTGVFTFTPTPGFVGTADPASFYLKDSYSQSATSTYTATVTLPGAPTAAALTSTGVGTAPQSRALVIPSGGGARLLDGTTLVTTLTIPGQGTYGLDAVQGVVTFMSVNGFTGVATPVTYRLTDSYDQSADSTYTPTVTTPPAPVAPPVSSDGAQGRTQQQTITIPDGGSITLLDGNSPVTSLTIAGQGTYSLNTTTGVITFTPLAAFSGAPQPVTFLLTDAYGQSVRSTYAPAVTAAILVAPAVVTPATVVSDGGGVPTSVPAGNGALKTVTHSAGFEYSLPLGLVGMVLAGAGLIAGRRRRQLDPR